MNNGYKSFHEKEPHAAFSHNLLTKLHEQFDISGVGKYNSIIEIRGKYLGKLITIIIATFLKYVYKTHRKNSFFLTTSMC